MEITIIGAGMGGLTAALALKRHGHSVTVYDRVDELRPVGAALSIWPNGAKILHRLGLGDALEQASGDMRSMRYFTHDGNLLSGFGLTPLYDAVDQTACPIARAELQRLLLAAVGHENVRLGAACQDFETHADGITAHFESGERQRSDLLVIADGTHSRLRDRVIGRPVERRYCGYVNWNVRVPVSADLAPTTSWDQYVGAHQRVSLMPMGTGGSADHRPEFYCFFDVPLPSGGGLPASDYRAELRQHFAGWASPVTTLIERFDPALMARVAIHDIDPLPTLVGPRVALLGDAAHAMAPDLGQGGCQAMEDAWVLATLLNDATDLPTALAAYDRARVERVGEIVQRARKRADLSHGRDPGVTARWYRELDGDSGEQTLAGLRKTVEGGPLA